MYGFVYQNPVILLWPAYYTGTSDGDTIEGHSIVRNTIWGYGGDDRLIGNVGDDFLFGGMGNDHLFGQDGDDNISGDYGDDWLYGGAGNDVISGDDGDDQISPGDGDDQVSGGDGVDRIGDTGGTNVIHGGNGNDWIYLWGYSYSSQIYGDDGDDYIESHTALDYLHGGAGNDHIYGGEGDNIIFGDEGDDTLLGGAGNDTIYAGTGKDKVFGEDGDDAIYLDTETYAEGNAGNDTFLSTAAALGAGHFFADGGEGHDKIQLDWATTEWNYDLPLSALAAKFDSIEEIDARWVGWNTTMHLKPADVLDLTETGELQIDGNSNHVVKLEGIWKDGGLNQVNGFIVHDYISGSNGQQVTVHVESAIHVDMP